MIDIKDEIIQRMKLLHLHPNVIREFEKEQRLNKSESPLGLLYWLTDDEIKLVKKFEQEHQDLSVYHILKSFTRDYGIVYDLLYISKDEEKWKTDRENLTYGLVMSYTVSAFAECGLIKIKSINGGLVREY